MFKYNDLLVTGYLQKISQESGFLSGAIPFSTP